MATRYPTVSVIISTYNRAERLLPLALDSVLLQTFSDFEIIVADDASTDNTPEVLKTYYDKFLKRGIDFRAFRLKENSGYQCVPKNQAIYLARGDYIAYLDDDNEWEADHLRELVEAIESADYDIAYCWRRYVKDGSEGLPIDPHPPAWEEACNLILSYNNCIDTSDMLHSRGLAYATYDRFGCIWNEDDRRFGDLNLLRRFIQVGARGILVPKELSVYRWHGDNLMMTRPVGEGYAAVGLDMIPK